MKIGLRADFLVEPVCFLYISFPEVGYSDEAAEPIHRRKTDDSYFSICGLCLRRIFTEVDQIKAPQSPKTFPFIARGSIQTPRYPNG